MKSLVRFLVLAMALMVSVNTAMATWGDYDSTFGFLGVAVDNSVTNHQPWGVAVQPDGKILVTGHKLFAGNQRFFLRRYLSNGQVDTSFGNNGSAIASAPVVAFSDYYGSRIIVQADGKIVVAGRGDGRPAIWRFLASGSPDSSIGTGGMKVLYLYEGSGAPSIATQSNILYVGVVDDQTTSTRIIKFNSDGTQDTSFGTSGEAITDASLEHTLAVDPTSGNVLIGGRRRSNIVEFGVQRFLPTGALDPTFTHWGGTYNNWPTVGYRFLRKANGSFVVNERFYNITGGGVTVSANLVRLNSTGGFINRNMFQNSNTLNGVCPEVLAEQQDGKVILRGADRQKLYRYAANFLTIQSISCSSYNGLAVSTDATLQPDDKMIAGGTYNGGIMIVRTIP